MTEYLIFCNAEWVTDACDEQSPQRSHNTRALIEEV
jgi:hypothetical protein